MGSGYRAMSASYDVFSTPHSRWITRSSPSLRSADAPSAPPPSYALDDLLAEDPVGADHERHDHQDVRGEVLGAPAHQRVQVPRRHVLDDAHDEPAEDGAGDRVEPAEDHHGEHLE